MDFLKLYSCFSNLHFMLKIIYSKVYSLYFLKNIFKTGQTKKKSSWAPSSAKTVVTKI